MLVEAGAGTGKTTILVDRIINILRGGDPDSHGGELKPFKPERLAAITFTEKAAAEMKARVRDELNKIVGEEKTLLQAAYDRLERAQITTIHGFALNLIRERPVEAGISPVADIIDGVEKDKILEHCWERWLLDNLSDTRDEPLEILFAAGLTLNSLKKAADIFISDRDILAGAFGAEKPDITKDLLSLADVNDALCAELSTECADIEDNLYVVLKSYRIIFADILRNPENVVHQITASPPTNPANKGQKSNWKEKKRVIEVLANCYARINELRADLLAWAAGNVASRLNEYVAFYQEEKRKRGLLDFTDILIYCRDMLRDNREVRGYFQKRFDYILVDEFQDTDPIQAEIAFYLAEASPDADDWREVKLQPGKLFLVGDPKQSIYRFRRADIAIYNRAADLIGEQVEIIENFRCRPSVIEWVNHRFESQMTGGEMQADYISLNAHREESEPSVIVAECGEDVVADYNGVKDGKLKKSEWQRAEAAFVAGYIRRSIEEGLQVHNKDGTARPAGYGDFALLFFSTSPIAYYEEALHRAGIPNELYRDKAYFGRSEVNELISIMAALADPYDDASMVGTLRSSFFGASDADLVRYRAAGGNFDYTRCDGKSLVVIADCFEIMRELRSLSVAAQPSYVLSRLFELTMNRPLHKTRYGGGRAVYNLNRLQEMARQSEASGVATLPGLVRWFRKLSAVKDEGDTPASSGDSVILNTVHSAKGLEYNVVILPNLINGFQGIKAPGLLYYREGESDEPKISLALKADIYTANYKEHTEIIKNYLDAERVRLAYVAATRARDYLILPAFIPEEGRDKTYAKYLLPEAGDYLDAKVIDGAAYLELDRIKRELDVQKDAPDIADEYERWKSRMNTASTAIESAATRIINPSALGHSIEAKHSEDAERDERPRDMPRRIGNALHYIMENVDFSIPEPSTELVETAVNEFKCEPEIERITEMARNCLASSPLVAARDADKTYRELNFVYPRDGKLVEGVVDLVYIIGGRLYIADYKSDAAKAEDLAARADTYNTQMAHYAAALRDITGMEVAEVSLIFAAVPETVSLDISRLDAVLHD